MNRLWSLTLILWLPATPLWASSVTLAWDASSGAEGYRIYYGQASRTYHTVTDVGQVTTASIAGLTEGEQYCFACTAYKGDAESAQSNEVQTVVGALVPGDTTPPTVAITSPTKGATVRRNSSVTIRRMRAMSGGCSISNIASMDNRSAPG